MNPDALRDALLAAAAAALLFMAVTAARKYRETDRLGSSLTDAGTVAVVVFVVMISLPMWNLGADEILPPPFTPTTLPH